MSNKMPKGAIIASCGHRLAGKEGTGKCGRLKDQARDGSRAVRYGSYCSKCHLEYKKAGLLLTKRQADRYLEEEV